MKGTLTLNEHTMQALQKLQWEGVEDNRFCAAINDELFSELTGLNTDFISCQIEKNCYCEASYWREEKNVIDHSYYLSVYFASPRSTTIS